MSIFRSASRQAFRKTRAQKRSGHLMTLTSGMTMATRPSLLWLYRDLRRNLRQSDPRRIDVTYLFALASNAPRRLEAVKRLLSDNKRGYWLNQSSLAYAILTSEWTESAKLPPSEQAAVMRALVDEVVRLAPSTYVATTYTRSRIAKLLDDAGDNASAEGFLEE